MMPSDTSCWMSFAVGDVADVGEGDPVAEGGHAVGAAGAGIGAGQRGKLDVRGNVVHLPFHLGQGQAQGRARRGDVLERGRRRQARRPLSAP